MPARVQLTVKRPINESQSGAGERKTAAAKGVSPSQCFSFGARRYSSTGARRLFVPQEIPLGPVAEATPVKAGGLWRTLA